MANSGLPVLSFMPFRNDFWKTYVLFLCVHVFPSMAKFSQWFFLRLINNTWISYSLWYFRTWLVIKSTLRNSLFTRSVTLLVRLVETGPVGEPSCCPAVCQTKGGHREGRRVTPPFRLNINQGRSSLPGSRLPDTRLLSLNQNLSILLCCNPEGVCCQMKRLAERITNQSGTKDRAVSPFCGFCVLYLISILLWASANLQ